MRVIDADALTEDCKRYLCTLNPDRDGKECTRIHWLIGVLGNAPTIEPEPHWIPCSERLPEEDGLYLVTTSKGQVQVHVFNHNGNSEEYWMRCNMAWMPLLEPYREGES